MVYPLPFGQQSRDTESDLESLGTQPTQKNLWKIWKAVGGRKRRRNWLLLDTLRHRVGESVS